MRIRTTVVAALAAVLMAPALARAAAPVESPSPVQKASKVTSPTHATNGILKTLTGTALVIARTGENAATETFVVTASTVKKGDLSSGVRVEVRYRAEGGQNIATAITASAPKGQSAPGVR